MRLFLTEEGSRLHCKASAGIKIKRYARAIEGHVLDFKPGKRRRS